MAYLYSLDKHSLTLLTYEGYVQDRPDFQTKKKPVTIFVKNTTYGGERRQCSIHEGVVHNFGVWFNERKEIEARHLLVEHFRGKNSELFDKILHNAKRIQYLKIN